MIDCFAIQSSLRCSINADLQVYTDLGEDYLFQLKHRVFEDSNA